MRGNVDLYVTNATCCNCGFREESCLEAYIDAETSRINVMCKDYRSCTRRRIENQKAGHDGQV